MNKITLSIMVLVSSVVVTSCGGGDGGSSDSGTSTIDNGGVVTSSGSLPTGPYSIPTGVDLTCNSSVVFEGEEQDMEVVSKSGAQGDITADCNDKDFVLKDGFSNLNITSAIVTDYWYCKDKSNNIIAGYTKNTNLSTGAVKIDWNHNSRTTISCEGSIESPLPSTITDNRSIEDLLDYENDVDYEYSRCTYSGDDTNDTSDSCDNGDFLLGTNATFSDDQGGTHKVSKTLTYIFTTH